MRIPTLGRLIEAFGVDKGTTVYALLKGTTDYKVHPAVVKWAEQCYHDPRDSSNAKAECLMVAIDAELETYGVEAIRGRYVDRYHQDVQATYCNTGDTYATTILYDCEDDRMLITAYGDWIETHSEREVA